jgi:hypothetical protein
MTRMQRMTADKKISISIQKDEFQMTTEHIRVNPPDLRYPRAISRVNRGTRNRTDDRG